MKPRKKKSANGTAGQDSYGKQVALHLDYCIVKNGIPWIVKNPPLIQFKETN